MKFYYFNGDNHIEKNRIKRLEDSGFTGVLFVYDMASGDFLIPITRDLDISRKLIYMVAMRPYAMSPQYLSMISHAMHKLAPNRLQYNIISGHIKEHEKLVGGILGEINDLSHNIDRSNYLIEYIKELSELTKKYEHPHLKAWWNGDKTDFFVTTSNEYVFDVVKKLNQKMIIQYREYKQGHWTEYENYGGWGATWLGSKIDLEGHTVMISISPVLRDTEAELEEAKKIQRTNDVGYFTYEQFKNFVIETEKKGIDYLMLNPWPIEEEEDRVINFIQQLKQEGLC